MIGFLRAGKQRPDDRCPPDWVLSRHVSGEPPDAWLEGHLARCARCAAECAVLGRVVTQAQRHVRANTLSAAARRAIATRLLTMSDDLPVRRGWRRGWVGLGAAAAVAVIVAVVLAARGRGPAPQRSTVATTAPAAPAPAATPRQAAAPAAPASVAHESAASGPDRSAAPGEPPAPEQRSRATIRAIGAARFTRAQTPPDDVVQLGHGAIVLEVAPLAPGERFRVRTDDAEVEVRGTRFRVSAFRGKLTAVSVSSGRVEVRSPGGGHVVLEPGDEWVRQANAPQDERRGEQRGGSEDGRSAKARPSPTAPASFVRAWSLLRAGDARRAAALFAEVERTAGDRDIAEDALYWRAVATAKAGDRAAAQALFEQFFRRFPSSSRAGEAATALGWLYIESGELAAARRSFERAENDPSAAVRASARDGLRRAAHP